MVTHNSFITLILTNQTHNDQEKYLSNTRKKLILEKMTIIKKNIQKSTNTKG